MLLAALAGCSNTPPPPVVTSPVAQSSPTPTDTASQIVIGVDDIVGGYNPHALADSSVVTSALAQLLLPSVFRPGPDGVPKLDTNLMRSAEVISGGPGSPTDGPFVVAYDIRPDASWSDGAPIAAEDFVYLANAMREQPGVVEPAGYRLITGVQSREGGKRVEVTFAKPYPAWQTLFDNLLPQHLLKDAPGGWRAALEGGFPAYGGPFAIKNLDRDRGEIILERNERYWEKPAAVDRLVFRRGDQPATAGALGSGTVQLALVRTDSTGLKRLGELGQQVELHTVARPRVASVLLRPAAGQPLADERVRAGVAALLDRGRLIEEGVSGGASATLRADAQVTPPAAPGYRPTAPPAGPPVTQDLRRAEELLTSAGYVREAGLWRRDGRPLSLVVASPGEQEPYASIAKELSSQLVAAGVEVRTTNPAPRELFTNLLALPAGPGAPPVDGAVGVDIAVVPQTASGNAASVLASNFGCRTETEPPAGQENAAEPPANPASFCDKALQPSIEATLTGAAPPAESLANLEPELWRRMVNIPLFQLADTLAVGKGVSGVVPGPPMVGPFGNAVNWTRGSR
ncbi:ABC transporter family substrate-binding protein [Amycolatopsis suaedae]|uniref:ABC transporter family substrate-binding protein n=1 Tax=Amycolatopsis suaedae TaxID=2510978 RepID=A0A4Q7J9H4_9PSEU|nr:ABC transporter family substrate-binding protein [Amycolatopsis suaedae]